VDVDDFNRLPMHCFLSNPPHGRGGGGGGGGPLKNDAFECCLFDLIPLFDVLYRANPQALQTRDALGMLPLHIAIQSSWSEQLIMVCLVYHYPECLECPVTVHLSNNVNVVKDNSNDKLIQAISVLPFQLAALTPNTSLTTVYRLVRQDPRIAVDAFRYKNTSLTPSSALLPIVAFSRHSSKTTVQQLSTSIALPRPPLSTTTALCQFVKSVGKQQNARLWREMIVLLTTSCTNNIVNTFMYASFSSNEVLHEDDENDRFNCLQLYLMTEASPR
jgi:hypothetical protein